MALGTTAASAAFKKHPESDGTGWYWTLQAAGNHEQIAWDRGYPTKLSAELGISNVRKFAPGAKIYDTTKPGSIPNEDRFELFTGSDKQWYFRFVRNGTIFARSEGYVARQSAIDTIHTVQRQAPGASEN